MFARFPPSGLAPKWMRDCPGLLLAMIAGLCFVSSLGAFAFEWDIQRFEGRDYVSTLQVAEFYNLPRDKALEGEQIGFSRGGRSIVFRQNSREVVINGLRVWLAFPAIERGTASWVSRLDLSRTIEPALRPELAPGLIRPATVVLDAGHGGSDKGAVNQYQFEKNFNLDVARRVRDELVAAGVDVFLTRNSDGFLDLPRRAAMANQKENAIFVSIHFNSAANRAAQGFEVFAIPPRGAPSTEREDLSPRDMVQESGNAHELQSFLLAKSIYHAMHGRLRMMDRGIKRSRFAVLRLSKMPAVLLEGGFLSNPIDARRIASPEWRTRYAKAVAEGILAYMRLAEVRKSPPLAEEYRIPGTGSFRVVQPAVTPAPPPPPVGLRELPEEDEPTPSQQTPPAH